MSCFGSHGGSGGGGGFVAAFKTKRRDAGSTSNARPSAISELSAPSAETPTPSQMSNHSVQGAAQKSPPPPPLPPSHQPSTSTNDDSTSNSSGVKASHPHEHGLESLLHSPVLKKNTKAIGKLFQSVPSPPHLALPHAPTLHVPTTMTAASLRPHRPSVTDALSSLELDDTPITIILDHMRDHPTSNEVQERGCARLTSLAKERDNMVEITERGGIDVIILAMKDHADDDELITQGMYEYINT